MHCIRVGRMFGIELRVDWSILVIFGFLTWEFGGLALPKIVPGYSEVSYWGVAVATTGAFIATLAAHELGHSYMARRRGIRVTDITLWMLGGLATIDGAPKTPRDELEIAGAGPAVSAAIGAFGTIAGIACVLAGVPRIVAAAMLLVGMFNLLLAVFNLAPAAPLDGGRILHAWLWHRSGDRARATVTVARAGEGFAWILIASGFAALAFRGDIGGLWTIVLGAFLLRAARGEVREAAIERTAARPTTSAPV